MVETALDGIFVTELGGRVGIAICGALLRQLGATVIAVEQGAGGKQEHRAQLVAGKLSFAPNASDEGLLRRLLERSDVVLVSSDVDPPCALPDTDIPGGPVVCDLTAFGTTGELAGQPWSDLQVQALTGICDTTGTADGPPVAIGVPICDVLAGTYAAGAALAALRVRRQCGIGQAIDIALFDAAFVSLNTFLGGVLTNKGSSRSRLGNRHPTVAPWNRYRALDGWVLICAGNQGQWQRLCGLIGRADFVEPPMTQADRIARVVEIDVAIEQWTSGLSIDACIAELVEAAIACGPIAPIDKYPREANLDYRGMIRRLLDPGSGNEIFVPASPLRMSVSPGLAADRIPDIDADREIVRRLADASMPAAPAFGKMPKRPLDGVRVIEIGQYTTAPLSARHLAHLGAEVIKVEQPGGDESRTWVPHQNGRSISFRLNNADKRSMVLDLRSPHGARVLARLLETADILVENLKPGTLARFGFSPQRLAEINPRLVYCAITGFGTDSIYASRPAFDMVIQAMSGFMAAVAPGALPLKSGISTADTMGAEMAIVAMLAALEYRDRTGRGQYIDLSMQDISAWLTQTAWNRDDKTAATHSIIAVRDGYVLAEANAVDLPMALEMDRAAAAAELSAAGINASPVLSVRESAALPHTLDRRLWASIPEDGAHWPILMSPLRLQRTPPFFSHLSPTVDADGPAIIAELGLLPEPVVPS